MVAGKPMKRGLRNAALTTARREEPSDVVGGGTIDVERLECEREREQEHTVGGRLGETWVLNQRSWQSQNVWDLGRRRRKRMKKTAGHVTNTRDSRSMLSKRNARWWYGSQLSGEQVERQSGEEEVARERESRKREPRVM